MSRWVDGELWYTPEEWLRREQLRDRKRRQIETSSDPPASGQQQPAQQPKHPPEEPKLWK